MPPMCMPLFPPILCLLLPPQIDKAGLTWTDQMERDSRSLDLGAVSNTILSGGPFNQSVLPCVL